MDLVFECVAIIFILIAIFIIDMRANRPNYSLAVVPLAFVPGAYVLARLFPSKLPNWMHLTTPKLQAGFVLIAMLVSCVLIGFLSASMETKKARVSYVVLSSLFIIVLTFILIFNTI